jgi:hypothetical protein
MLISIRSGENSYHNPDFTPAMEIEGEGEGEINYHKTKVFHNF